MSDSEDSDFSDNQSERSSDGEAEEVEENEVCICFSGEQPSQSAKGRS